ncbi:isoaspartyl peptidase/L-asparaginase [Fischerella sp. PCC 9605]|uniref:isoaspartyl peptidase/L-asparaginase n=1 Tax=Fischerella sp. PCC 9605 TaxID=1173024 RepID=UPI0004ADDE06|nr:isoaspartyl peptidase/L-asparaginase [Fischerella sp. PCC 9605]
MTNELSIKSTTSKASKVTGEAGCILLDHQGRVGWAYNSQDMAVAYMTYMTTELDRAAVFTKKECRQL